MKINVTDTVPQYLKKLLLNASNKKQAMGVNKNPKGKTFALQGLYLMKNINPTMGIIYIIKTIIAINKFAGIIFILSVIV